MCAMSCMVCMFALHNRLRFWHVCSFEWSSVSWACWHVYAHGGLVGMSVGGAFLFWQVFVLDDKVISLQCTKNVCVCLLCVFHTHILSLALCLPPLFFCSVYLFVWQAKWMLDSNSFDATFLGPLSWSSLSLILSPFHIPSVWMPSLSVANP